MFWRDLANTTSSIVIVCTVLWVMASLDHGCPSLRNSRSRKGDMEREQLVALMAATIYAEAATRPATTREQRWWVMQTSVIEARDLLAAVESTKEEAR